MRRIWLLVLVFAIGFSSVSKANPSCENFFGIYKYNEYTKSLILRNQSNYLQSFFLTALERYSRHDSGDFPTYEQAATMIQTTRSNLHAKVWGRSYMSFEDIIAFSTKLMVPMMDVMAYATSVQNRINPEPFMPMIQPGSYQVYVHNPMLSLGDRIQLVQEKHIAKLIELRGRTKNRTRLAREVGMTTSGLGYYMGISSSRRINFINGLKLADALDIDVRDVFSFLLDFEGIDLDTNPRDSNPLPHQ